MTAVEELAFDGLGVAVRQLEQDAPGTLAEAWFIEVSIQPLEPGVAGQACNLGTGRVGKHRPPQQL